MAKAVLKMLNSKTHYFDLCKVETNVPPISLQYLHAQSEAKQNIPTPKPKHLRALNI